MAAPHKNAGDAVTGVGLTRPVYCVLGIPIDAVNLTTVVHAIEAAAAKREVLLI